MVATLNDIEEGFRAINEAERRVTVAREGKSVISTERIRENMQFTGLTIHWGMSGTCNGIIIKK